MFLLVNHFVSHTNMHAEDYAFDAYVLSRSTDGISVGTHGWVVVIARSIISRVGFLPAATIFVSKVCFSSLEPTAPRTVARKPALNPFGLLHFLHNLALKCALIFIQVTSMAKYSLPT